MHVLQVNAFHYLRGGVERAYLDEARWLAAAGHDVLHLAVRDARNLFSPTRRHFAPPAEFGEGAALAGQLAQLPRALWSRPAARAMEGLLREARPDIAHVHAPSRYLTPSVLRPLERAAVPVVMTLHDYKPWCTNRTLFAHGVPCERCRGGRHWHALATACVQGSRARSAVGMIEAYLHQAVGAYRSVRRWIAPSRFVLEKAVEHGVERKSLRLLPHGVEAVAPETGAVRPGTRQVARASGEVPSTAGAGAAGVGSAVGASDPPGEPFVLFSGRVAEEKGVRLLPGLAMRLAPIPVVIAGDGPLRGWLERQAESQPNLRLAGHLDEGSLSRLRAAAAVTVVPSLFYETFCYAVAEALLDARPVVAARIGAIPELIEHEVTGLLVAPGDTHAMAEAVRTSMTDPRARAWAEAGRARVAKLGDPRRHLEGLLAIYREAMDEIRDE